MISIDRVYSQLKQQTDYISVVELAMILEANTNEVRQRLIELGERVTQNEHDEWRVVGELVQKSHNSPLSESETQERNELENTVSQAFYLAGQALKTLRDKRLYRESHTTFESYVKERFNYTRAAAYYLINASEVVENLKCQQIVDTNKFTILPTKESQCRAIAKLPPERQREVWSKAVEKSEGKVPPARIVKQILYEIEGKPKMELKPKKEKIIQTSGLGIEYVAYLDEETYWMLIKYQEKIGTATFNGAIRRLLDEEKQRDGSV